MSTVLTHVQRALKAKKEVALDVGSPNPITTKTADFKILEDGIHVIYENGVDRLVPLSSIRFIDTQKPE